MVFAEPELLILMSLAAWPKYGYAMMADIRQMANLEVGLGTLYGALTRLEQRGVIEPVEPDDRRRTYQLTLVGSAALRDQLTTMESLAIAGLERLHLA